MYSPASLPLEHAPVASCLSKTRPGELEDSVLQLVQYDCGREGEQLNATISQFVKRSDQWLSHDLTGHRKLSRFALQTMWMNTALLVDYFFGCFLDESHMFVIPGPKLPEIPKEEKYRSSINLYGIGFDHSTYEHKVVKGLYTKHNRLINLLLGDFHEDVVFSVYTLETDSWRKIEGSFPYRFYASEQGIMLNGDLHWFGERLEDQSRLIVSVALTGEERIREIPLPLECGYVGSTNRRMKLGVFRQWLCITYYSCPRGGTYNEFWVMTEYGVRESWTKMRVSIPYSKLKHSGFWTKEQLIMYNFNDESHWKISIRGIWKVGRVFTCLESLISLKQRQRSNLKIEA
ncbi:F-box/kelch-repeat protein [Pyrus ussuriensis x Pyrus communis]|uniref:F-box/kelch-repeat protein n=1 Tax=Pyrus ussuriensis x Pyrus communis TaxID=2448454 RepID=A0A5N5H6N0_9ROSA|nr:F-box/kelch-repeat protein [Pyrus ussuriensis x Pyrus communis]